jgi:hypothetical protein
MNIPKNEIFKIQNYFQRKKNIFLIFLIRNEKEHSVIFI